MSGIAPQVNKQLLSGFLRGRVTISVPNHHAGEDQTAVLRQATENVNRALKQQVNVRRSKRDSHFHW